MQIEFYRAAADLTVFNVELSAAGQIDRRAKLPTTIRTAYVPGLEHTHLNVTASLYNTPA